MALRFVAHIEELSDVGGLEVVHYHRLPGKESPPGAGSTF